MPLWASAAAPWGERDGNDVTSLYDWLGTAPGRWLLHWERQQCRRQVSDLFGYHAVQLGTPHFDALAGNRMPHRWLGLRAGALARAPAGLQGRVLATDYRALPFPEGSIDLVVLPHTLELSANPHATLREVSRVLVHEGHVVITGFNPFSLWGWRDWRSRLWQRLGLGRRYLPPSHGLIRMGRLRDWLGLLDFELESVSYGVYQPALRGRRALARMRWLDRLGRRWWPILGAAYCVVAVKRTPGATLIGQTWQRQPVRVGASAPVPHARQAHGDPAGEGVLRKYDAP